MSLLDKLKFWKKEDEFGAPADFSPPPMGPPDLQQPLGSEGLGLPQETQGITAPPSFDQPAFGGPSGFGQKPAQQSFAPQPSFAEPQAIAQQQQFQQQFQQPFAASSDRELQLISSKLDTIKAQLETVLQRLDRLERKEEHPYQQRWRTSM